MPMVGEGEDRGHNGKYQNLDDDKEEEAELAGW